MINVKIFDSQKNIAESESTNIFQTIKYLEIIVIQGENRERPMKYTMFIIGICTQLYHDTIDRSNK